MRRKILLISALICLAELATSQIKVACVGNSITYGSGIEKREIFSYPAQLQRILGEDWEVRNFGVSGGTMLLNGNKPYWLEKVFTDAIAFNPDVLIIKLGTNDSKDFNWAHQNEFLSDYQAMIDTFKTVSNPVFFLCQPVPAFGYKWSIDSAVVKNEIVPLIKKIGNENDLNVIDLFTPFSDLKELFPDEIHPNAHGASLMAGIIVRYMMMEYNLILLNKIRNEK